MTFIFHSIVLGVIPGLLLRLSRFHILLCIAGLFAISYCWEIAVSFSLIWEGNILPRDSNTAYDIAHGMIGGFVGILIGEGLYNEEEERIALRFKNAIEQHRIQRYAIGNWGVKSLPKIDDPVKNYNKFDKKPKTGKGLN